MDLRSLPDESVDVPDGTVRKLNRRIIPIPPEDDQSSSVSAIWENNNEVVAGWSPIDRPMSLKSSALRRIFIARHGERVDFTFGSWIPYCFDESGKYVRKDLNMPLSLPERSGQPEAFAKDCPLTTIGETQAGLVGQALRLAGIDSIRHAYASPSLRCLQTCRSILKGLADGSSSDLLPMSIEPGLFEWLAWYADYSMPQFLTPAEAIRAGFLIDPDYRPLVELKELSELHAKKETAEQYYVRSHFVAQSILRKTEHLGGDILLVGHASTLDACTRQLIGCAPRSALELSRLVHRIPYCSLAVVQQETDAAGQQDVVQWKLVEPPVPPITYSANLRFDWTTLVQPNHS